MEKEFVPYKQALSLKELGFNEPCLNLYHKDARQLMYKPIDGVVMIKIDNHNKTNHCSAPTFSQTFRWFREKYKLVNYIEYYAEWNFEIFRIDDKIAEVQDDVNVDYTFKGGTYEEAELECLKKLIEIVKEKQ
jgi:hypothetical protein